jgi:hypothetical protein
MLFEYKNRTTIFHSHAALPLWTKRLQPSIKWTINIIHCPRYLLYALSKKELKSSEEGIFSAPYITSQTTKMNGKAR